MIVIRFRPLVMVLALAASVQALVLCVEIVCLIARRLIGLAIDWAKVSDQTMDPTLLGILGFVPILILLSQRVPVALAMIIAGFAGLVVINSWQAALAILVTET